MANSKSLASYTDVHGLLVHAITKGKLVLTFDHPAKARRFQGRAHWYRSLLRKSNKEKGLSETSAFDNLVIRHHPMESLQVIIEPEAVDYSVTDERGNPVEVDKMLSPELFEDPIASQEQEKFFERMVNERKAAKKEREKKNPKGDDEIFDILDILNNEEIDDT